MDGPTAQRPLTLRASAGIADGRATLGTGRACRGRRAPGACPRRADATQYVALSQSAPARAPGAWPPGVPPVTGARAGASAAASDRQGGYAVAGVGSPPADEHAGDVSGRDAAMASAHDMVRPPRGPVASTPEGTGHAEPVRQGEAHLQPGPTAFPGDRGPHSLQRDGPPALAWRAGPPSGRPCCIGRDTAL
jgi:hypothetical protein